MPAKQHKPHWVGRKRGALLIVCAQAVPLMSHAATLKTIIESNVLPIFTVAISFIMTLSVLAFMIGVVRFMYTAGDDKSRTEGKKFMVWGIIILFVMVTLWGIVGVIKNSFFGTP